MSEPDPPSVAGDTAAGRRLPPSPVRKPDWATWTVDKKIGVVLLLIPVFVVVGFAAQALEVLYYLFYVVTSPYWISRALWRALRPVRTEEHARLRSQARARIRAGLEGCGCFVLFMAAVLGFIVLLVNWLD